MDPHSKEKHTLTFPPSTPSAQGSLTMHGRDFKEVCWNEPGRQTRQRTVLRTNNCSKGNAWLLRAHRRGTRDKEPFFTRFTRKCQHTAACAWSDRILLWPKGGSSQSPLTEKILKGPLQIWFMGMFPKAPSAVLRFWWDTEGECQW